MTDVPQVSRRTLVVCLLASVALHAVLLLWLPQWRLSLPASEALPVLDVVMVADVPQPAAAPPRPVPATAALPRALPVVPRPAPQPLTSSTATPVAIAPAAPVETAAAPAVPAAEARPAVRSDPPAAAAAAPQPSAITPPAFNAAYLRNPPPAYPAAARRSGEEGTVMLRVLVSRDGAPLKIEVDQSSRSRALDDAALAAVKDWRFVPARRGSEAIEGWVRVPLVFRLDS